MASIQKSLTVRGGMVKITCSRCNRQRYMQVATGTRRKIFRCTCGLSASYNINYRSSIREQTSTRAQAVLANAKEAVIRLCDISAHGIGFTIPPEHILSLRKDQEIRIKFKGGNGILLRKIRIKNIAGNRIGAQYA